MLSDVQLHGTPYVCGISTALLPAVTDTASVAAPATAATLIGSVMPTVCSTASWYICHYVTINITNTIITFSYIYVALAQVTAVADGASAAVHAASYMLIMSSRVVVSHATVLQHI